MTQQEKLTRRFARLITQDKGRLAADSNGKAYKRTFIGHWTFLDLDDLQTAADNVGGWLEFGFEDPNETYFCQA